MVELQSDKTTGPVGISWGAVLSQQASWYLLIFSCIVYMVSGLGKYLSAKSTLLVSTGKLQLLLLHSVEGSYISTNIDDVLLGDHVISRRSPEHENQFIRDQLLHNDPS